MMASILRIIKPWVLHLWAVLIAVTLWLQVHGQGEGSLSMEVPLQVQALPARMVVVNQLPNKVRITVKGLQARLKTLQANQIFVPLNVSDLTEPGVVEKVLYADAIRLPAGLLVEKIEPDRLEIQVDKIVSRTVTVHPQFDLPQAWQVDGVTVEPMKAHVQGPEVWMESLTVVETVPLRLELKEGPFEVKADAIPPTGKSVHLEEGKGELTVRGVLSRVPVLPEKKEPIDDKGSK